jgi:hypothetical protein
MFLLRRIPALLALLMLGALSLRLGLALPVAALLALACIVLLFTPKPPTQTLASALLWVGALAWIGVAAQRISERLAGGLPWLRLALIFAGVALFTAWAAWLLRTKQD